MKHHTRKNINSRNMFELNNASISLWTQPRESTGSNLIAEIFYLGRTILDEKRKW